MLKDNPIPEGRGLNIETLYLVASHLCTNLSIFSTTKVGGAITGWQKASLKAIPSAL
jgi:hypothetical protein